MRRMLAACLIVIGTSTAALAAGPREAVQASVERVVAILMEIDLSQPPSKESRATARTHVAERRDEIRQIAAEMFDFEEISRRALSSHWASLTPTERAEFVRLFTETLERMYLGRLEDYSGERFVWVGETVDGEFAAVRSKVVFKRGDTPLEYRLRLRDDRWRVYDLAVEGMSLVGMYRSQFDRIIRMESFDGLLERLRKRNFETAAAGPAAQGL